MSIETTLQERSSNQCELCQSNEGLVAYALPFSPDTTANCAVMLCSQCHTAIDNEDYSATNHWRCISDAMWSPVPAVQVLSYRVLKKLSAESWAQDNFDMLYLEQDMVTWAEAGLVETEDTVDVNGVKLQAGDNVTLVKDLNVKGGGFTAKQGTVVRGIRLSQSNHLHIEGKINGQNIVIIAAYCKKS